MGQKVNPIGFRLQVNKNWRSRWYMPKRDFADRLAKDLKARKLIKNKFGFHGAIDRIVIEQTSRERVTFTIHTAPSWCYNRSWWSGTKDLIIGLRKIYNISVKINVEESNDPGIICSVSS